MQLVDRPALALDDAQVLAAMAMLRSLAPAVAGAPRSALVALERRPIRRLAVGGRAPGVLATARRQLIRNGGPFTGSAGLGRSIF